MFLQFGGGENVCFPSPTRSPTPSLSQALRDVDLLEEVEVFFENEWRKGKVRAILENLIRVCMCDSEKVHDFKKEEIRYLQREEEGEQNPKEMVYPHVSLLFRFVYWEFMYSENLNKLFVFRGIKKVEKKHWAILLQ